MQLDLSLLSPDGPIVKTAREKFPNALAVYGFGSRIQGTDNAESDLDLAVLVGGYVDPLQLWDASGALAEIAQCPVDLLDLRAATTVMQYQVITTGIRLWAADVRAGLFECYVLSEKTALDVARARLMQDIATTGKIYA
ncbi:MAG: nucleotidyltransferase domain-containing protein [Rhodoferax sp.]|nr:nucleotidyltransferase domain-containing protein [Rhodoferax sp.]